MTVCWLNLLRITGILMVFDVCNVIADNDEILFNCRNLGGDFHFTDVVITRDSTPKSCDPEQKEIAFANEYPVEISIKTQLRSRSHLVSNITWSQYLPSGNGVIGYWLQIAAVNSNLNHCIRVKFPSHTNLAGKKKFMLQCLTSRKNTYTQRLRVFPIINSSVRVKRQNEHCHILKKVEFDVAYNYENSSLSVIVSNHSYPNYENCILMIVQVNGSNRTQCKSSNAIVKEFRTTFWEKNFIFLKNLTGNFCVRLRPLKCPNSAFSNVFNFSSTGSGVIKEPDCFISETIDDWNISISVTPIKSEKQILVLLKKISTARKPCYTINNYTVTIANDNNSPTCAGPPINRTTVIANDNGMKMSFTNLTPGRYCVRVIPISEVCNPCPARYSGVKELGQDVGSLNISSTTGDNKNSTLWSVIIATSISCVFVLAIVILLTVRQRYMYANAKLNNPVIFTTRKSLSQVIESLNERSKIKVFLVYYVSNPAIVAINPLVEVLRSRLHCEVTLNNRETAYRQGDESGMSYLNWSIQKLKSVDFVLVMLPNVDLTLIKDNSDEHGLMFLNCIETIKRNTMMQWSEKNVGVFRFDNSQMCNILSDVIPTTWSFPKQLGNFFAHLHNESILESEFQEFYKSDLVPLDNCSLNQEMNICCCARAAQHTA